MPRKKTVSEIYKEIARLVNAGKTNEALEMIQKDLLLHSNGLQWLEQVVEEAFNDKNFKLHSIIEQEYQNALVREIQLISEVTNNDLGFL